MLFNSHPSKNLGILTEGTLHEDVSSKKHIDWGLFKHKELAWVGGDIQFDGKGL